MTAHPGTRADSVLTDQEQDDQREHLRSELDATPSHSGVNTDPATSHAAMPAGAGSTKAHPGDRNPPRPVTGGAFPPKAGMAIEELSTAVNSLKATEAWLEDLEPGHRLPSVASYRVSGALKDALSALADIKKEYQNG